MSDHSNKSKKGSVLFGSKRSVPKKSTVSVVENKKRRLKNDSSSELPKKIELSKKKLKCSELATSNDSEKTILKHVSSCPPGTGIDEISEPSQRRKNPQDEETKLMKKNISKTSMQNEDIKSKNFKQEDKTVKSEIVSDESNEPVTYVDKHSLRNENELEELDSSNSKSKPPLVSKSGVRFEIGFKVEALDRFGKWYLAKIIGIDKDSKVLIHFERWNSRYDEWVNFNSDRLRPVQRMSARNVSPKKNNFSVDEIVLARWTDKKMYPAKVTKIDNLGYLTVMFYDGIKKKVKECSINKLPADMASGSKKIEQMGSPTKSSFDSSKHISLEDRMKKNRLIVGGKFQAKRKTSEIENVKSTAKVPDLKAETSNKVIEKILPSQIEEKYSSQAGSGNPKSCVASVTPAEELTDQGFAISENMLNTHSESKKVARKEFIIEEDHNHFKCTFENCGKSFRKEKFLHAHLKHYHGPNIPKENVEKTISVKSPQPSPKLQSKSTQVKGTKSVESKVDVEDQPSKIQVDQEVSSLVSEFPQEEPKSNIVKTESSPIASNTPKTPKTRTLSGSSKHARSRSKSDSCIKSPTASVTECKIESDNLISSPNKETVKKEINVTNVSTPKTETPKNPIQSSSKSMNVDQSCPKENQSLESDKSSTSNVRASKRRRLDTAESISSTISIDSCSVQSEADCTVVDVERLSKPVVEPVVKKSRSKSKRSSRGNTSGLVRDEIVNCSCGLNDENGFMVQCELCYAWQHGSCTNISKEDEVPDRYICHSCLDSKLCRDSMKYNWDMDWYKKGEMARFNFLPKPSTDQSSSMLSAHHLACSILSIKNVLNSLKYKLKIAQNKYHPDLDYFKQPWSKDCKPVHDTFNVTDSNIDGTNMTNMDAIVSAIGALGIPLGTLQQTLSSNDSNMFFDPNFFPGSKVQDSNTSSSFDPCNSNSFIDSNAVEYANQYNFDTSKANESNKAMKDSSCSTVDEKSTVFKTTSSKQTSDSHLDDSSEMKLSEDSKENLTVIDPKKDNLKCEEEKKVKEKISLEDSESTLKNNHSEGKPISSAGAPELCSDENSKPLVDTKKVENPCETSSEIRHENKSSSENKDFEKAELKKSSSGGNENATNKNLLDQYIPDMIPSSMAGMPNCEGSHSSNIPFELLTDQSVDIIPQSGTNLQQELTPASDFNAPLPISISDTELVQSIGLSCNFNEAATNSQPSASISDNDFIANASIMNPLTKEEEEEMIKTLNKPLYPMVPVPREPDVEQFQRNVVDHIEDMQEELEHRLGILETQVEILEMELDSQPTVKSSNDADTSRIKRTMKKFLRDMCKLKVMTEV